MGRIGRLPTALVALVLRHTGGLRLAALGAELAFVHRTAGAGPANAVRRLGLAALRAELPGGRGTTGTLPRSGRGGLGLTAALAEFARVAALATGTGPASGSRGGGLWRLLLLTHGVEVLCVQAAGDPAIPYP